MRDDLGARWTYDDLARLPDDGRRHELIDGEHFVSSGQTPRHQGILINLVMILGNFVHETKCGELFAAPLDVVLSSHDVVEPDLLFIAAERQHIIGERYIEAAPDLAIEIYSPSSRRIDAVLKRHLYEKYGVAEYWLVDPEAKTVEVLRRRGNRLRPEPPSETFSTPLLPGLAISLAEVFE